MTNTKHDEEINKLKEECLELDQSLGMFEEENVDLANNNEQLRQTIIKMDNDINDAHKDLVEIHDILAYGNSCGFEEDIAAALRITVKYSE